MKEQLDAVVEVGRVQQHTLGEHKIVTPVTYVDISAMHADCCMRFYKIVKQSNIHFITKFYLIISENDKLMLYDQEQPPFLSI